MSTHSCKRTLLSWAAKAGLSREDRLLLGAHKLAEESSLITYPVDPLSGPLQRLEVGCAWGRRVCEALRRLPLTRAYHTPMMAAAEAALAALLDGMELSAPSVPLVCNGTGGWMDDAMATSSLVGVPVAASLSMLGVSCRVSP